MAPEKPRGPWSDRPPSPPWSRPAEQHSEVATPPPVDEPVLELVIVQSTKNPDRLSLRCRDDLVDGGQVTARLNIAGFKAGDLVELRRRRA